MKIVNFLELAADFELTPAEALAFFTRKGLKISNRYDELIAEEHQVAFTVAKMSDYDLLRNVKEKLDDFIGTGGSFGEFKKQLIPILEKTGWWGETKGKSWRLETIFRTNLQSSYSVGRWQAIQQNTVDAPYLMYDAVDDHRVRKEHSKYDNLVLRVTHSFWDEFYPPNDYNCRCGVLQLDESELRELGIEVGRSPEIKRERWVNPRTGNEEYIPEDLSPNWNRNPGKSRFFDMQTRAAEKLQHAREVISQQVVG